ncbi:methyltransferase family protein [Streptomyces syringium]|uniref:Protein-S-isoprenylcysteine O-methyltransferase Ste14 n=1 Tax=Streptomyces syringium TaxID=76729 RepID=A0ABS4XZ99_9ACTN|nr:isoprenylcysteine carboxylmethyltransferase family protein [Streptomyces syringium]MBP2401844.1 protein-S-isoprenylcysteine O-methyltransferase Ste14 [Streptomyces syringium]
METWTGWTALSVYLAGGVVDLCLRSWLHYRATGDNGHRYTPPALGTLPWWSQILTGAGLVLGAWAPVLAVLGLVSPAEELDVVPVFGMGLAVAVVGFAGVFAAQQAMGRSWRIGVDTGERTALVTSGVFGLMRNPIYTALLTALTGMVGMVPSWLQLLALLFVFAGVELQVRYVEEPYLARTHGTAYLEYTAVVGRFVPGVGRAAIAGPAGADQERDM